MMKIRFPVKLVNNRRFQNEKTIYRSVNYWRNQIAQGRSQHCRHLPEMGIAKSTFYNWRSKYAELEVDEVKRLKSLELENNQLKKLLGEQLLEIKALKEVLSKKW